jgi:hypothetical protein
MHKIPTEINVPIENTFKPLWLVLPILFLLLMIGTWSKWYAREVSIPRYCENPELSLQHLEKIITDKQPAGGEPRKSYIITAKLLFLLPRKNEETVPAYLERVRIYIKKHC